MNDLNRLHYTILSDPADAAAVRTAIAAAGTAGATMTGDITMSASSIIEAEGAAVASAATCEIWVTDGGTRHITGTTTITSLGTATQAGQWQKIIFDGILTLTHGANLNLPGSANITTAADDFAWVYADTTTQHDVLYFRKSGAPASMSQISASLGADVALNNTASYFDGPSVAQGSVGTWFASGTVTLVDTAGGANYEVRLTDGTNTFASADANTADALRVVAVSLSGFTVAPVGNIRIQVRDTTLTTGKILYNQSTNTKDSTITAIRIA